MAKATSGFQHSLWHQWIGNDVSFPGNTLAFCPFLSLAVDSEGRSKQCSHPTGDKCCKRMPGYRRCSIRGTLLLPTPPPRVPLPRKMRILKQASANGFLWCAKRWALQVRPVSVPFLVRRASCSAPGSYAAFWSVWISKLFNYSSVAGAEVREEKFIIPGSLLSDGKACFASFLSSLCCCECFESWSQTQLWPSFC